MEYDYGSANKSAHKLSYGLAMGAMERAFKKSIK